jgi:hypothetical protein
MEIKALKIGKPEEEKPSLDIGRIGSYDDGMPSLSQISLAIYECMLISPPAGAI